MGQAPNSISEQAARKGRNPRSESLTKSTYAKIALIILIIGVGLLLLDIHEVPKLVSWGVQKEVYFVLLIICASASAVFLFGVLASYAQLEDKSNGLKVSGPAVIFLIVLFGGLRVAPSEVQTFDLTVRCHSADGSEAIIRSGAITVDFGSNRRTVDIDHSGEANFKGIPSRFQGTTVKLLAQVPGYVSEQKDYTLEGNVLEVSLLRLPPPVTHLRGTVEIGASFRGKEIVIFVDGQDVQTTPDQFGRFELEVNGKEGDRVRLKVLADKKPIYDDYQILPGPVMVRLGEGRARP